MSLNILCLDIGSGTQDALYYSEEEKAPGALDHPKFVLPSPARLIASRIFRLGGKRKNIYLHGCNMGGGFFPAIKAHLEAGLEVSAHPEAALALSDDPKRIESRGISLSERRPQGFHPVLLGDYEPAFWRAYLGMIGLEPPDLVLAAAQDHGFHPGQSNRVGRFKIWERFLTRNQGRLDALVYADPPAEMTRLAAISRRTGGGYTADTGAAAVLGPLWIPEIEDQSRSQGILILNIGNSHTVAFLVFQDRIWGVYEQHTGLLNQAKLLHDLSLFRAGKLNTRTVMDQGGHGCLTIDLPAEAKGFEPVYIIGPKREMMRGQGEFPAPGGDMMLAGCFGLLKGYFMTKKD